MRRERSLLDDLEAKFRYFVAGPRPLALDGRAIGEPVPARMMALDELRDLLVRTRDWSVHDAAVAELVRRAKAPNGDAWMLAVARVLLPALRVRSAELSRGFHGDLDDLEAEMLAALVAAVRSCDASQPQVTLLLLDRAYVAARRFRRGELRATARSQAVAAQGCAPGPERAAEPLAPPEPWHDPEFVLAFAVKAGVLRADEAILLAATQLYGIGLNELAIRMGANYATLRQRHLRARRRLRQHLQQADT